MYSGFSGFTSSLQWLHENLTEAADDLDQNTDPDDDDGVPLVPIAEEDVSGMEDSLFQKMLLDIGISKPGDEQVIDTVYLSFKISA